MIKHYKYRIYPNAEQRVLLARTFGCTRFVSNQLLDHANRTYQTYLTNPALAKPSVSGYSLTNAIPSLKQAYPWLAEVSSVTLQQAAQDLGRGFTNFFQKRARYPRFKARRNRQSFRLTANAFRVVGDDFTIAKATSPIRVRWSRPLPSPPTSVTITQDPDGRYYASFCCAYTPDPTNGDLKLGLDLGISSFYTDSLGGATAPPKYYRRAERRLARAQRALARKQPKSRNREKARRRVAKLHAKTKHQRSDFLHQLSRRLVNDCRMIAIENLNVTGMVRNRHLAKSISDLGWSTFVDQLRYKVEESQWCSLVQVGRWFPSTQTCSVCGHRQTQDAKLKLSVRRWTCPGCNTFHERDTNAAVNILNEGLRFFEAGGQPEGRLLLGESNA